MADFIAKIGLVIEESDESALWLEFIIELELLKKELVEPLLQEAYEFLAIMITSSNTATKKKK